MRNDFYFFCLLVFVDILLMKIYCSFAFWRENRSNRNLKNKVLHKSVNIDLKKSQGAIYLIKKLYNIIDRYMYGLTRYNLMLTSLLPSYRFRYYLYRYIYGMQITHKTVIFGGCEIRSPWNIKIGNSVIAGNCILDGRSGILIKDNVVLGSGVHIWTQEHDFNDPYFRVTEEHSKAVVIEEYAWVCSDTTVLPGVHIKEGAVIACRACVTKDCEKFVVYGGVPAKQINYRNNNLKYELSGNPVWHFW